MIKTGIVLVFLFVFLQPFFGQDHTNVKWGISTNLPMYVIVSPNLKAEIYFEKQFVLSTGGSYGWWGFDWDKKRRLQQWSVNLDGNYYFKDDESFTKHRIGLSLQTGQFDRKKNENARRGHFSTVGLLYGYTWKLRENLYLDAGLGFGYIYKHYHKYFFSVEDGRYCCAYHEAEHRGGITNLNVSLVYRFPQKSK